MTASTQQPDHAHPSPAPAAPAMGFWKCWSMSVGVMIGSGVFLLPAVLAPYGGISFLGWLTSSVGAVLIALVLGRLASRTQRSGGFYLYARGAFGDLAGFVVGWSYWVSLVFAVAAISIAFAGYAGAFIPGLSASRTAQAAVAAVAIWALTSVNLRGVAQAASFQLATTLLKIAPLLVIIAAGLLYGDTSHLPPFNPQDLSPIKALATTALLTMWAFIGLEAAAVPAGDVIDPQSTIPRAVVAATVSVAAIYVAATGAVMLLVPQATLATSQAPFADAAHVLGSFGAPMIALGALISTAGSLNGNILLSGQMPAAIARDGLAPKQLANTNKGRAPAIALGLSSVLASSLLLLNTSAGLVSAFTVLISISTLAVLMPYAISALAEFRQPIRSSPGWTLITVLALLFALIAIAGAGATTLLLGVVLLASGLPVFFWSRRNRAQR